MQPFHLAVTVDDLAAAEAFYHGVIGAAVGRRAERWIDFDLYGHQLSLHLDEAKAGSSGPTPSGAGAGSVGSQVDGDRVPVPHFGVVLELDEWRALGERLRAAGVAFVIPPRIRFQGEVGEQGTFFLRDPAGNALEFKGFRGMERLFAS